MDDAKSVPLSDTERDYVDGLVQSGAYASPSEVVSAGLRALRERDLETEWLRAEAGPVYDAMIADPSRAIPADEVFERLRLHREERVKRKQG